MAENIKFAGLEPSPNTGILQVQFLDAASCFPRHLSHGPAPDHPGPSGEVAPRPLLKDKPCLGEEAGDGLSLGVADLEQRNPAGAKHFKRRGTMRR